MASSDPARLTGLTVADPTAAWIAAGFTVEAGHVHLGGISIRLVRPATAQRRGLVAWTLTPAPPAPPDGLALDHDPADATLAGTTTHRNTVTVVDHVVIGTGDLDRTARALAGLGWSVRDAEGPAGTGRRYRFLLAPTREGKVVIELIQPDDDPPDRAARFWGVAVVAKRLDQAAEELGPDVLGPTRQAIQPGRRIATIRGDDIDLRTRLALMSPRPRP